MSKVINKVGFLVHHQVVFEHITNVIENLESDKLDLIVEDREFSSYGNQLELVSPKFKEKYNIIPLSEALNNDVQWKVFVAFHPYVSDVLTTLGSYKIRFMYGMGEGNWIFGDINNQFDLILTHGVYASNLLRKKYGVKCKIMGYPRYVGHEKRYRSELANDYLGVTEVDKVIIWFPTVSPFHSINEYMDILSKLNTHLSVKLFIKLHPMTMTEDEKLVDKLKSMGFKVLEGNFPIEYLYKRADLTLHDVGGTALSVLFLDKMPVFLKSTSEVLEKIGLDSPEVQLMNDCPVLSKDNLSLNLTKLLHYNIDERNNSVKKIKFDFFADLSGKDDLVAAKIINSVLLKKQLLLAISKLRYVKILRKSLYRMM